MKQIIAILAGLVITTGAIASPLGGIGRIHPPHTVVVVRPSFYGGFGYRPLYYSPFWGYNALYSPYYSHASRPSKLDLNIAEINNDYREADS